MHDEWELFTLAAVSEAHLHCRVNVGTTFKFAFLLSLSVCSRRRTMDSSALSIEYRILNNELEGKSKSKARDETYI